MKVYVVEDNVSEKYGFSGSEILGVYSSLEFAIEEANRFLLMTDSSEEKSQFNIEDWENRGDYAFTKHYESLYWSCAFVSIEEFDLDCKNNYFIKNEEDS